MLKLDRQFQSECTRRQCGDHDKSTIEFPTYLRVSGFHQAEKPASIPMVATATLFYSVWRCQAVQPCLHDAAGELCLAMMTQHSALAQNPCVPCCFRACTCTNTWLGLILNQPQYDVSATHRLCSITNSQRAIHLLNLDYSLFSKHTAQVGSSTSSTPTDQITLAYGA